MTQSVSSLALTTKTLTFTFTLDKSCDSDLCIFSLGPSGKLENESYFVFFNQLQSPEGEITLLDGSECIKNAQLNLEKIPKFIDKIVFTLTSDYTLSHLKRATLKIEGCGEENIDLSNTDQAILLCELVRSEDSWHLNILQEPHAGDLSDVLNYFGGQEDKGEQVETKDEEAINVSEEAENSTNTTELGQYSQQLSPQDTEHSAKILALIRRIPDLLPQLQTEEATKHTLVMPLLQALGYDVFNPAEIQPEYVADVGTKKGEKVDYAILQDEKPIILIECKHHDAPIDTQEMSQLYRYFSVVDARFAILTNGITYKFFSDLEKANTMDAKPFLEINLLNLKNEELVELLKFAKNGFDQDDILSLASEMRYITAIKQQIAQEFRDPSDEFVKILANRVYNKRLTTSAKERFTAYTKKALSEFVTQMMNDRLRDAFGQTVSEIPLETDEEQDENDDILTTSPEELQAFYMIRSLLHKAVKPTRVTIKKRRSYSAICLDNNSRRTICRLYFSGRKMQIGVFDSKRKEKVVLLRDLDGIFKHAEKIEKATLSFE